MKKLTLLLTCFCLQLYVIGQNPDWIMAPNQLTFPTIGPPNSSPLPQPTVDPDGSSLSSYIDPENYYYGGELPQFTSNMIKKPSGEIEFFIVDNHIYDKQGYSIANLMASENATPNPQFPATGASEILIIPDPSNCERYYIVSTTIINYDEDKLPYLFLLDMSLPNDIYLTLNLSCELKGALIPMQYSSGSTPEPIFYMSIDDITNGNFIPDDDKRSGVFFASSKKRLDNSYKAFISNGDALFTFTIDQSGFHYTNAFPFPDYGFNSYSVRGEMDIAELDNGNYRIAVPYNNNTNVNPNVRERLYTADITSTGTVDFGTEKIFDTDIYDNAGSDQSARFKGVEFSENGQYLYVTHTFSPLNPNTFEFYDYNSPTAGLNPITLPSGLGLTQNDFQFSLLERGFNNQLFIANQNGLYQLADMNNPSSIITHPSSFQYSSNHEGINPINDPTNVFKLYMLPDQIDGMDYEAHFNSNIQCCLDSKGSDVGIFIATTNATWNIFNPLNNGSTTATISKELRIPAGKTVTIDSMTLKFAPGAHLVIENGYGGLQGGKLILNNSILTSDNRCGNSTMWLGVEVWGNQNTTQGNISNSTQGRLIMTNSTIENASVGVLVSKRKVASSSTGCVLDEVYQGFTFDNTGDGGIVQAKNSTFLNNQRGVWFRPYTSTKNNLSHFYTSDFIWNNDILIGVQDLAKLDAVFGVNFRGCNFKNNITIGSQYQAGYGINSRESQFYVTPFCASIILLGQPCPNQIPSVFENLNFGIRASNSLTWSFTCTENKFIDNRYGIYVSGTQFERILKNTFEIREASNYQSAGISLNYSTDYTVQENTLSEFDNPAVANGTARSFGIVVNSSGEAPNEIYKNDFWSLNIGGQTEGINAPLVPVPSNAQIQGLQWLCNDFKSDIYEHDMTLMKGRMDYHQGFATGGTTNLEAAKKAANNKFSLTGEPFLDFHDIYSESSQPFVYAHIDAPRHKPDSYSAANNLYLNAINLDQVLVENPPMPIVSDAGTCPSKIFKIVKPVISFPVIFGFKEQAKNLVDQIDDSRTNELLDLIENGSDGDVKSALMDASPYLSDEVLIKYIGSNPPHGNLKQVMIANSNLSNQVKEVLSNHKMPNGTANQIADVQIGKSERTKLYEEASYLNRQAELEYNELISRTLLDDSDTANIGNLISILEQVGDYERLKLLLSTYIALEDTVKTKEQREILVTMDPCLYFMELTEIQEEISPRNSIGEYLTAEPAMATRISNLVLNSEDELISAKAQCLLDYQYYEDEVPEFLTPGLAKGESYTEQRKEEIDLHRNFNVSIYPNPTTGIVNFDYPDNNEGIMEIQIISLDGKVKAEFTAKDTNGEQFNVSHLYKGYYLVKIKLDGQVLETQKLEIL